MRQISSDYSDKSDEYDEKYIYSDRKKINITIELVDTKFQLKQSC